MYVCMYVYIYMRVCVCMCVYAYVCMCVCMYVYIYIYVCVCVCMYLYVCICVCMYVCMYVYIYIYMCVCVCVCVHVCMHIRTYLFICTNALNKYKFVHPLFILMGVNYRPCRSPPPAPVQLACLHIVCLTPKTFTKLWADQMQMKQPASQLSTDTECCRNY